MDFYTKTKEETLKSLNTQENWLSREEVKKRKEKYGFNEISETKKFSVIKLIFSQFTDVVILILIGAAILSFSLGENIDGIVISVILIVNAILWFVQEYKAEKAVELLRKLSTPNVKVIRNWERKIIAAKELVPWDIVIIEAGDTISADIRLIETVLFTTDESSLTGESSSIKKDTDPITKKSGIADQKNMIFRWTIALSWRATGVVTETWMNTQLGNIATLVQEVKKTPTPLQYKLKKLGINLWIIVLIIVIVIFTVWWLKNINLFEIIFTSISLAVSAIPEWLPAVVTITLALWVQKMYKKNVLVKKLKSIETLWGTTVICSDKTWTITRNQMTVTDIFMNQKDIKVKQSEKEMFYYNNKATSPKEFKILFEIANNCNDAVLPNFWDPTEIALLEISKNGGITEKKKRTGETPFDSINKYMITEHKKITYIKWSPESVLSMCTQQEINGKIIPLQKKNKEDILQKNKELASKALRVLWFGYKTDKKFVFVGLMGMIDPPRPEVKKALDICKKAGIRVIMITGDQKTTAMAIAKQIWIEWWAMEWKELDELKNINDIIEDISIFARVNPEHKVKILSCLQDRWEIVAMTGDWINDAPAIKKADVGIAMSRKWTDIAREAADIILIDDNFASIVNAVEYWRIMYNNIKKFVKLLLSANFDEVLLILTTIILWLPLPLLAVQILWLNLISDGLPALALGIDPPEKNIMLEKPRLRKEHILSNSRWFIIVATLLGWGVSFSLFLRELHITDIDKARTIVLTTIIIFELFLAFTIRSDKYNIRELKTNKYLRWWTIISLWLHIALIYTPIGKAFKLTTLNWSDWLLITWLWSIGFIVFEIIKLIKKYINKKKVAW